MAGVGLAAQLTHTDVIQLDGFCVAGVGLATLRGFDVRSGVVLGAALPVAFAWQTWVLLNGFDVRFDSVLCSDVVRGSCAMRRC